MTAVNAGGDTDSVGAIAGAISGAFNGLAAFRTGGRKVEGRDYLEGLARRLYTLTPAAKPSGARSCRNRPSGIAVGPAQSAGRESSVSTTSAQPSPILPSVTKTFSASSIAAARCGLLSSPFLTMKKAPAAPANGTSAAASPTATVASLGIPRSSWSLPTAWSLLTPRGTRW